MQAEPPHQQESNKQRQRNGAEGNQGRAPVHQKQQQHNSNDHHAKQERFTDVADGDFNELRLTERLSHRDIRGQRRLKPSHAVFNSACQLRRIHIRLLVDHQHNSRLSIQAGLAAPQRSSRSHLCKRAQRNGTTITRTHHGPCDVVVIADGMVAKDQTLLTTRNLHPAPAIELSVASSYNQLIQGDILIPQSL